jgi:hypothetical protein
MTIEIDLNDPEHAGGRWLQPLRDAAEKIRLLRLKAAKKSTPQPKKETK